jgi:hypothetical protein
MKKYECDVCNKMYKNKKTLETHKKKYHKDINMKINEEIFEPKENMIEEDSDELLLEKFKRLIEFENFIKSCNENIVDILIATSENDNDNTIRWICGYEKLKRDNEFETIEDKVKYYKDLIERNRVIII